MVLAVACGPRDVVVELRIPDQQGVETPLQGVRLQFLPYDRDSILTTLENRAPSARPDRRALDSLMAEFRGPFNEYLRLTAAREAADSGTRPAFDDSVSSARQALDRSRRALETGFDQERSKHRAWEDTAFRSFDSITTAMVDRLHRDPVVDSTRAGGVTTVRLRAGDWWVVAHAINLQDPNAQWYWNVKVEGDTVRLGPRNGRIRPRF